MDGRDSSSGGGRAAADPPPRVMVPPRHTATTAPASWEAQEVHPRIFLGPWSAARNESFLRAAGITHVLSMTPDFPPPPLGFARAPAAATAAAAQDSPADPPSSSSPPTSASNATHPSTAASSTDASAALSSASASASAPSSRNTFPLSGIRADGDAASSPSSSSYSASASVSAYAGLQGTRHVPIDDSEREDLLRVLPKSLRFLESALGSSPDARVLVHCNAGVSRSAAVVLAYMVKHGNMTLREAEAEARSRRPQVGPNCGFWASLIEFEQQTRGGPASVDLEAVKVAKIVEFACGTMGADQQDPAHTEAARQALREANGSIEEAFLVFFRNLRKAKSAST